MSEASVPPGTPLRRRVLWYDKLHAEKPGAAGRPGDILALLSRAWRSVTFYNTTHAVAQAAIGDLSGFVTAVLSERPTLRLFIQDGTFFEEGRVLLEETLRFHSLLTAFTDRKIGAVQLTSGVERRELERLIEVLTLKPEDLAARGGAEAHLRAGGVTHITVGSAIVAGSAAAAAAADQAGPVVPLKADPADTYRAALRVMDALAYEASMDLPLNLTQARTAVSHLIDILSDERAAALGLAALKNYDEDTYHHSVNVCILSLLLASQLNMDRAQLVVVGLAGLLHDIGKVRVPQKIIGKPATLTLEEMEIVKRHTIFGARILRELPDLSRLAMVAAFEHHAGYNLSGYPEIAAKKIPHLVTRIVFVADCFDEMTGERRLYRSPKRIDEALKEILDGAGTMFDPVLAKLFCKSCRAFLAAAEQERRRLDAAAAGGAVSP